MKLPDLSYFFTYETHIPDGVGFPLFGAWHLLWLSAIAAACAVYLHIYKKSSAAEQRRMDLFTAWSLPAWIAVRAVYIGILHENFLYELPLHLCSLAGIFCAVHVMTHWNWLGHALYAICLPGTVLALLFPNWVFYPPVHFITIEGFCFHGAILLYVTGQLTGHGIVPEPKKLWQVVLFLACLVLPVYVLDKKYAVNYMFVNVPSQGSPLVLLEKYMGNPGYLYGYAALVLLCMLAMDAGYACRTRKKRRDRK